MNNELENKTEESIDLSNETKTCICCDKNFPLSAFRSYVDKTGKTIIRN